MKTIIRVRWGIAVAFWCCAIVLTLWNNAKISRIAALRQISDRESAEYTFQRRHHDDLLKIVALDRQQYLKTESAALARVQMDSRITDLTKLFHLNNVMLLDDTTRSGAEQLSYRLNARGSLEHVLLFLSALHDEPYLVEHKTDLKITDDIGTCLLDTGFTIFLKTRQEVSTGPHQIGQGNDHHPDSGPWHHRIVSI